MKYQDSDIVYEKSETLRAEVFKNLGYFLASIPGLTVIQLLVYGKDLFTYINFLGILMVISLFGALEFIGTALVILQKMDQKLYLKDKHQTKENK